MGAILTWESGGKTCRDCSAPVDAHRGSMNLPTWILPTCYKCSPPTVHDVAWLLSDRETARMGFAVACDEIDRLQAKLNGNA